MKLFFLFCFIILSTTIVYAIECEPRPPVIIYLKGTCSSGKTSFTQSIAKQCDIEIVDEDSIMQSSYVQAVKNRFPDKFTHIAHVISGNNFYHALREKDILFKKDALNADCLVAQKALSEIQEELNNSQNQFWKQKVSNEINNKVIENLTEAIKKNKNVILDSWYLKESDIKKLFPEIKLLTLLLYCPLSIAFDRLQTRNETALLHENLQEKRYLRQLLGSFSAIYEISTNPALKLQEISRSDLEQTFNTLLQFIDNDSEFVQKPIFTFAKLSLQQFLQMKSKFLKPLESTSGDVFYISPQKQYDLIIDNSTSNIQKAVNALKELL